MINFGEYLKILKEGGGGGHMNHPFDLPGIDNGKQLYNIFERSVKHIKAKSAATKLDGVNVSVRLVKGPQGLEWAMDRGSMKLIDLDGITLNRLEERFPPQISENPTTGEVDEQVHGMVKAGQIVLTILNNSLKDTEKEIKKLKLDKILDGKSAFYLNAEFIESGGTNVVNYGKNFIAFHGVNKFKHVTKNPATGNSVNRREGREVAFNQDAFESFVNKVQLHSRDQNFDTHGVIGVEFTREPAFQSVLDTRIEIDFSPSESETKTLDTWLFNAKNPHDTKIKMHGKNVKAMEKKVYQFVIGNNNKTDTPLSEAFEPNDIKTAIDAAIFWHATRLLGKEVNESLATVHNETIPVGEGIVIRDLPSGKTNLVGGKRVPITMPVFKITGDFIISGLQSTFGESLDVDSQLNDLNEFLKEQNEL